MRVLRTGTFKRVAVLAVVFACLMVWAIPAQALTLLPFPIFFTQGISGTVRDAGTTAPIGGVIVSAYDDSNGVYEWSGVTAADGTYNLWLSPGTYRVEYSDPQNRYGGQWYFDDTNFTDALPITVTSAVWNNGNNINMRQAFTLKTVTQRAGHPLTKIGGAVIILQEKDSGTTHVTTQHGMTPGNGVNVWPGLRPQNVLWEASAIDPTARFWSGSSDGGWVAYTGGTVNTVAIQLSPAGASREITPTVPFVSKPSQKRNKAFGVSGAFTKALSNGSQIKILAVKGSTTKTFNGKIKSNKYSSSVKLGKGTWTLYALFGGNATFAANDSLTGKSVKVK